MLPGIMLLRGARNLPESDNMLVREGQTLEGLGALEYAGRPAVPNDWCRTLGIEPPRLESVANHRDANTFALLLVALLEHGRPMTLVEVAQAFENAGIAERSRALLSLQRCKPGRPPV